MDNALRYSPAGSPVALRAGRDGNRVVMSVRDRGPGIPPGDRARIFEKFYRGSRAGQTRGTGMGLSIAREIARAHQGDLWLASSSPEGSEFCLSIPVMPDKVAK